MNGKKLRELVAKYRELRDESYGEGDDFPSFEGAFSLEAQKQIKKRFGDRVAGLVEDLQPLIEQANDALNELDNALDTLELLGELLESAEKAERLISEVEESKKPESAFAGEDTAGDDSHKVKGD